MAKEKKHATSNPAELRKVLRTLGTKKQRHLSPVAWYRHPAGLAVSVYTGAGCYVFAGQPDAVQAAAGGFLPATKATTGGRIDAILDARGDVLAAYNAADAIEDGTIYAKEPTERITPEPEHTAEMAQELLDALPWIIKATAGSDNSARLILQSVAVQLTGYGLRLAGADNYRIHVAGAPADAPATASVLVWRPAALLLAEAEAPAIVNYHPHGGAEIIAPGLVLRVKDSAKFPDFAAVIPNDKNTPDEPASCYVEADKLRDAVNVASTAAAVQAATTGGSSDGLSALAIGRNGLAVASPAGKEAATWTNTAGEDTRAVVLPDGRGRYGAGAATMQSRYALDALDGFTGELVNVSIYPDNKPATFTRTDYAGRCRVAVVMPVRMADGSPAAEAAKEAAGIAPVAELEPANA